MFAIQNKRTGGFIYGTDYRYHPPHQRTSKNQMLTYDELRWAEMDLKNRRCSKDYKIVEILFTVKEVEKGE